MGIDYSEVTEGTGTRVRREAIRMLRTRYAWAARECAGKTVLEVACGSGPGLGLLRRRAAKVVGSDYTGTLARAARSHYGDRVPILRVDAQSIPFRDGTFDAVILFEAVYYLARPERFLAECRRVLRPGGSVLLCSANPEWDGFNPSPHSRRYFRAAELASLLRDAGFEPRLWAAFPAPRRGLKSKLVARARWLAAKLHLIPKTMKGKELLKRLFYGKLEEIPAEIGDDASDEEALTALNPASAAPGYQTIYAAGALDRSPDMA